MKLNIVKIKWIDAQRIDVGIDTIENIIESMKPVTCEIVGFVIGEDSRFIFLAQEYWKSEGMVKYINTIPKSLILETKKLT